MLRRLAGLYGERLEDVASAIALHEEACALDPGSQEDAQALQALRARARQASG